MELSRRQMLAGTVATIGAASGPVAALELCPVALEPTQPFQNFPEYLPGAPMRRSFLGDGVGADRVQLTGRLLTPTCEPVADARIEFWHTDSNGAYDMQGYRFRGSQRTTSTGLFYLRTLMPAAYNNNPRHIHFLVTKRFRDRPQPLLLSSAVYFPTPAEFDRAGPSQRDREFLAPDTMRRLDGVLLAFCDIVLEPA